MTIDELNDAMTRGFARVDAELEGARRELHGEIQSVRRELHGEIQSVRGEVHGLRDEVHGLRGEVHGLRGEIQDVRHEVKSEAETTRRHFDVMVEQVHSAVRLIAEGHGHHATVLDDHEHRLRAIEKRG